MPMGLYTVHKQIGNVKIFLIGNLKHFFFFIVSLQCLHKYCPYLYFPESWEVVYSLLCSIMIKYLELY